jgi:hypothetical protein
VPPSRSCELWTEGLGPGEHCPGRDIDATLSKELGDLPGGERVAQVPTDRGDDDLRRPTVAREGTAGSVGEVPMTEMASEALTTAAIETIARRGGLVAGRAGGARPYREHPTTSQTQLAFNGASKRIIGQPLSCITSVTVAKVELPIKRPTLRAWWSKGVVRVPRRPGTLCGAKTPPTASGRPDGASLAS